MLAKQPIDQLPDTKDSTLCGAWLNRGIAGPRDYSAAGDDMTTFGAPVWERVGARFDGTADYLRRAEANWRSVDHKGTITAWIKTTDTAAVIWGSCRENLSAEMFFLTTNVTGIRLDMVGDSGYVVLKAAVTVADDVWHHVAVKSNGTSTLFYVDGQELTTVAAQGTDKGEWLADVQNRANITIGVYRRNILGNYFNGLMRDVQYYSEDKSADWIKHEYQKGVPDDSLKLHVHKGDRDLSRYERVLIRAGGVIVGHDMEFDGVNDYIDCGDVGNLQVISLWINPDTDTEEILQVDAGKHITVSGGTVTYTGLTAVATYVNSVAGTTLAADLWQHLVCVVEQVDGDNFELGREGANYGDIKLKDVRVFDEVKSAGWVKKLYRSTRIFY